MKKIVTIGGGSGQSVLLGGLRSYPDVAITAIVSMMDSGGSSGRLRDQYGILPPGDIRRCFAALSNNPDLLAQWNARDDNDDAVGNIVLYQALLAHDMDWLAALQTLATEYDMPHTVLPVTLDPAHLIAALDNGERVCGEEAIDVPQHDPNLHIQQLELDIPAQTLPQVISAISAADIVVLAMGDLYTSVIPNLLVSGVTAALQQTAAPITFIVNRTTKPGETHGFSTSDFVEVVKSYLYPARLGSAIVDNQQTPVPSGHEATAASRCDGVQIVAVDLADPMHPERVGAAAAAAAVMSILGNR